MVSPPFTTPQVAQILELPLRKVISFIERGLVSPSLRPATGHGSKRLWSYEDVVRCEVIKYLSAGLGVGVGHLRMVAEKLAHDSVIASGQTLFIRMNVPIGFPTEKGIRKRRATGQSFSDMLFFLPDDADLSQMDRVWPVHIRVKLTVIHAMVKSRISKIQKV